MKILIINSVIDFGSTGRICIETAKQLIREGHEVKIAYGRMNATTKDNNHLGYRIGTSLDVKIHVLLTRLFDAHGFGSKKATQKFVRWANKYNPDVVWLNNLHGYYINVELLFDWIRTTKRKVVWTLHDCWAFTGHCTHFSFAKCDKWKTLCTNCEQSRLYPKTLIPHCDKNFIRKKTLFTSLNKVQLVSPSHWLKSLIEQSFLSCYPVKVINNGIDQEYFFRDERDASFKRCLGKKCILCISSIWTERKGIFDVIELANVLKENFTILLVGKIKPRITLPRNVIHIKRTNNLNELRKLYSACFAMFNPTYEDTYSNINMESLSCGTPVVCYRTGGAYEMLDSRFVIDQGDIWSASKLLTAIALGEIIYDFSNCPFFSNKISIDSYKTTLLEMADRQE